MNCSKKKIADYHIAYDDRKAKEARAAKGKKEAKPAEDEDWEPQGTPKGKPRKGGGTTGSGKSSLKSPPPGHNLMTEYFNLKSRKRDKSSPNPPRQVTAQIARPSTEEEHRRKKARVAKETEVDEGEQSVKPPGGPTVNGDNEQAGVAVEDGGVGQAADSSKTSSVELDVVT